ncbi:MAG: hypothetical protein KKG09_01565 [Verrucomicrobia bacterium]|nr:hypothetical protein [Verrucomicrobiota bacterium]
MVVLCLSLTSCVTCKQSELTNIPFGCVVQSEGEAVFDIHLDGKLVSSGKPLPPGKGMQAFKLIATPGEHVLMATAPGCDTWQKTITLMGGAERSPSFMVELKKSVK